MSGPGFREGRGASDLSAEAQSLHLGAAGLEGLFAGMGDSLTGKIDSDTPANLAADETAAYDTLGSEVSRQQESPFTTDYLYALTDRLDRVEDEGLANRLRRAKEPARMAFKHKIFSQALANADFLDFVNKKTNELADEEGVVADEDGTRDSLFIDGALYQFGMEYAIYDLAIRECEQNEDLIRLMNEDALRKPDEPIDQHYARLAEAEARLAEIDRHIELLKSTGVMRSILEISEDFEEKVKRMSPAEYRDTLEDALKMRLFEKVKAGLWEIADNYLKQYPAITHYVENDGAEMFAAAIRGRDDDPVTILVELMALQYDPNVQKLAKTFEGQTDADADESSAPNNEANLPQEPLQPSDPAEVIPRRTVTIKVPTSDSEVAARYSGRTYTLPSNQAPTPVSAAAVDKPVSAKETLSDEQYKRVVQNGIKYVQACFVDHFAKKTEKYYKKYPELKAELKIKEINYDAIRKTIESEPTLAGLLDIKANPEQKRFVRLFQYYFESGGAEKIRADIEKGREYFAKFYELDEIKAYMSQYNLTPSLIGMEASVANE